MATKWCCSGCLLALFGAVSLNAQERESVLESLIDKAGQKLVVLLDRPLHPFITSIAPGGGFGAGLTYESPPYGAWTINADAAATARGFLAGSVVTQFQWSTLRLRALARARDLSVLNFYGLGSESERAQRSTYSLQDRAIGAQAIYQTTSWLLLSAAYEELWPDVGRGRSDDAPTVQQRFAQSQLPGLTRQPRMSRYEATLRVNAPAAHAVALQQGGDVRIAWQYYDDRELSQYSFSRVDVQARQRFTLGGVFRYLTLHGLVSTTNATAGNEVPFYLQPALGGHGLTLGLPGEPIGSLETRSTLRGYATYRFRDRHLLLLQAEYRYPLWGPLDAILFADAGKVASRRSDLDLAHLKGDIGFGLSLMSSPNNAIHAQLAFGADGPRVVFALGQLLVP